MRLGLLSALGRVALLACVAGAALTACDRGPGHSYNPGYADSPVYAKPHRLFGVHPLHNPERLQEVYGPLVEYVNNRVPDARLRLEASRNYASYEEKLYAGQFDFALPNPYQTVKALRSRYRVFGKMGNDEQFRGIILVRKDSGIREPSDLKGKAVSFPAPTALAATMLPQYYLFRHGVDPERDIDARYVGSQESSIMNVYMGNVSAAATWPLPWETLSRERPDVAKALEVRWQTETLPNNSLVVREDVPAPVADAVADVLFHLHEHETGRRLLARINIPRFEPASAETYRPVSEFIERFSRDVRDIR